MGGAVRQSASGSRIGFSAGIFRSRILRAAAFICLLLAPGAGATAAETSRRVWAEPVSLPGVENLFRVSESLYRSGQPTAEGMRELEKLGVRTVINLRWEHDDVEEVEGSRLKVISIPTLSWFGIGEEDVVAFLRAATDPSNTPVLVHCRRGADRTGVMAAAYRIVVEGWTPEEAVAEMTEGPFGFNTFYFWLPRFVRRLDATELSLQAGIEEFR